MIKKILLVSGDPNSINSEIIYKTWKRLNKKIKKNLLLIGNYRLLEKQFKLLRYNIKIFKLEDIDKKTKANYLNIIDVPVSFKDPFNISFSNSSNYVIKCLNLAHTIANTRKIKGIINCSINKKLLLKTKKKGVTEFFASKCKIKKNSEIMMITNSKFSVVPLTTHINLKDIHKSINTKLITQKITSLNLNYKILFGYKPKIAILGMNPHNGELKANSEEKKYIIPSVKKLKKRGINVSGPVVADTVFINEFKKFDVIVGTYHDQVLTPFKALYGFDAINITLGLTYRRMSPDHGPALDIVKKKIANYQSLLKCITLLNKLDS